MAITVLQAPESYPSLHDDLWHVVSSSNVAEVNFKYIFDIYVNNVIVARLKLFPDPVEESCAVNVSNIVRNFWTSYFLPNTTQTAFSCNGNGIGVTYQIKYGEEYGSTLYANLTTASYTAYNFYPPLFRDWSTSYYAAFTDKWITNRDKTRLEVSYNEKLYITYFNTFPDVPISLKVSVDGGTVVTGGSSLIGKVGVFDISPIALNTYLGSTVIPTTFTKYTVQYNAGEVLTVYNTCSKHEVELIHFLNQLGGYDTKAFRLVNKQEATSERKSYDRPGYEFVNDAVGRADANKRVYSGKQNYSVSQAVTFKLTSDWCSETDYNWLRELINSPEVYMERGGYYYPVTIGTTQWQQKIRQVDKMFNLSLDVVYSRRANSQFR